MQTASVDYTNWWRCMEATVRGLVVLSNLKHDVVVGRVTKSVARAFLASVPGRWVADARPNAPIEFMVVQLQASPKTFFCAANARVSPLRSSRVMRLIDLVHYNIDWRSLGWLDPKYGVPPYAVERIEGEGALADIALDQMKNGSGFAWVTPTNEVDLLRGQASTNQTAGDLASLLHNMIGFTNPEIMPEQWAEVRYPNDAFKATPLTPPTFLDGAPSIIYRSHRRADGWGQTVNLTNMGAGLPEAVHPGVPFTDKFEVMSAGWTGQLDAHVDWSSLLANMQQQWQPGDEALVAAVAK